MTTGLTIQPTPVDAPTRYKLATYGWSAAALAALVSAWWVDADGYVLPGQILIALAGVAIGLSIAYAVAHGRAEAVSAGQGRAL